MEQERKERTPAEIEAEILRMKAEAEKAMAETAKARAEAAKAEAEAREAEADAFRAELARKRSEEEYKREMARDSYHHTYFFNSHIDEKSVQKCMEELNYWHHTQPGRDIEIVFFSPGGSAVDGIVLFNHLRYLSQRGHHITTLALGYAASMAGILLQAGDKRVMGREAYLLIHEVSFSTGGKIGDVEDDVKWVRKMQDQIVRIFAERSRQAVANGTAKEVMTPQKIKSRWRRKDWWLSSDEALRYGFVDEVR